MAPCLRDAVVSGVVGPRCVEEQGVPADISVVGGQLVQAQGPGAIWLDGRPVAETDLSPNNGACPGPERCSRSDAGPP